MERFTISLDDELAHAFEALMRAKGYQNRSEAVRDLLREELKARSISADQAPNCVGVLTYIYNHHERVLAQKMTVRAHAHHDLIISTTHAHLDHDNCIETMLLRGRTSEVKEFAESLIAEPGIRHGKVHLVPTKNKSPGSHSHHHTKPVT